MNKYAKQAKILKALAHPVRLKIIDQLNGKEKCVCEIVDHISAERTGISKHLAILVNNGILESRREGLKIIYSIKMRCAKKFLNCAAEDRCK
jgi:ArsR family transcriptional regulator